MVTILERDRGVVDEIKLMRSWSEWAAETRQAYLDAILKLPPEERHRNRGASFPSVQNIYEHILGAHIHWYEHIVLNWKVEDNLPEDRELNDDELRYLAARVNKAVDEVMNTLTPDILGKTYKAEWGKGDKKVKVEECLADIIWHLLEEQTQHIGELNALFWQMDRDPPHREWFSSSLSMSKRK